MSRIVYIGVDPASTRLHAVVIHGEQFTLVARRTMPADMAMRLYAADRWMTELVKTYRHPGVTVVVGIEEPVLGGGGIRRSANATIPNAMAHGALVAAAIRARAVVLRINNQRWKKQIVGKGNCNKEYVTAFVKKTWPTLYQEAKGQQDFMDASCIARHTQYVIKVRRKVEAGRRRAGR